MSRLYTSLIIQMTLIPNTLLIIVLIKDHSTQKKNIIKIRITRGINRILDFRVYEKKTLCWFPIKKHKLICDPSNLNFGTTFINQRLFQMLTFLDTLLMISCCLCRSHKRLKDPSIFFRKSILAKIIWCSYLFKFFI